MHVALTARRLKPGSYDDWRKAWEPDEWPEGVKAYILRKVGDPDDVIAFGMFEGSLDDLRGLRPDEAEEQARTERMSQYIESVGADGLYEVVDRVG
jgi:hypothetical protein